MELAYSKEGGVLVKPEGTAPFFCGFYIGWEEFCSGPATKICFCKIHQNLKCKCGKIAVKTCQLCSASLCEVCTECWNGYH